MPKTYLITLFIQCVLVIALVSCDQSLSEDESVAPELKKHGVDDWQVIVGGAVQPDPAVLVKRDGEPAAGENVRFSIEGEHGKVVEAMVTTNYHGRAHFQWFMEPDQTEEHRVTASIEDQSVTLAITPDQPDPDSSYFGRRQYVEYQPGTAPIILSSSHGGDLKPDEIPDRTWGVTVTDLHTRELTLKIADEIEDLTGDRPHVIISHLRRKKLDPNREIEEAAQGNQYAERAWHEYHRWVETARAQVEELHEQGFYVDVHGHGHSIQRLELGYLLRSGDLNQSDKEIDESGMETKSSIRTLADQNEIPFSELLRGENSLGEILTNHGYRSVPSASDKSPGDEPFFSGGFSTVQYGSRNGGNIDGVQLEANFEDVRDTENSRRDFAEAFSRGLIEFLELHTELRF